MDARSASGNGARLVARAWADAAFKERLLADAVAACAELGIPTSNFGPAATAGAPPPPPPAPAAPGLAPPRGGTVLTAVANGPGVHNLVVCTLCSCYPISVLGLSPHWYRSRAYRSRAVREPRALLAEFGTVLPEGTALRVHDSTADLVRLLCGAVKGGLGVGQRCGRQAGLLSATASPPQRSHTRPYRRQKTTRHNRHPSHHIVYTALHCHPRAPARH